MKLGKMTKPQSRIIALVFMIIAVIMVFFAFIFDDAASFIRAVIFTVGAYFTLWLGKRK